MSHRFTMEYENPDQPISRSHTYTRLPLVIPYVIFQGNIYVRSPFSPRIERRYTQNVTNLHLRILFGNYLAVIGIPFPARLCKSNVAPSSIFLRKCRRVSRPPALYVLNI